MPLEKDPRKRTAILACARQLFAARGFHATSVGQIARAADLPAGSLYTYFATKEDILATVIEEGWAGFYQEITKVLGGEHDPVRRLYLLLDRFLPMLVADADLVAILFSEGARFGNYAEKLNTLADLIVGLVADLPRGPGQAPVLGREEARVALLVCLLGTLDALRLSRGAGLAVSAQDIQGFMRRLVERTFPFFPA